MHELCGSPRSNLPDRSAYWTLAEEFGVIEDLVHPEAFRFGDRLKTELTLDPAMASREVPALLPDPGHTSKLTLKEGQQLPVSRDRLAQVRQALGSS